LSREKGQGTRDNSEPAPIRVPEAVRAEIFAHAREEAPRECCGLLVGHGTVVDECVRSRNVDPNPNRYEIDALLHIATNRRLRGTDRTVIGAYHSHPHSAAVPSESDRAEAYYPDFIWMIVSLAVPPAEAMAAFRLTPSGFVLAPIERTGARGEIMAIIESIRGEYLRYKKLAEAAIAQVDEAQLSAVPSAESNSIAIVCWHVSGNLKSRFTDFLNSDGEKPWRNREEEFDARTVSRADLLAKWEDGWAALLAALSELTDDHLTREVKIRGQAVSVLEALHRSLAHTSYHVGQIVYLAKEKVGSNWTSLSIPRGQSAAFNQNPSGQKPDEHVARLGPK